MVTNFMNGVVDPMIAESISQNRDSALIDSRWGTRNTTSNWAGGAWPFLEKYRTSLANDLASRALERYGITDTNYCFRGVSEYSMQWTSAEEELNFNTWVRIISDYAIGIDNTLDDYHHSRWDDHSFAHQYRPFLERNPSIPKFSVRTDVIGESGKTPSRTGVYVAQDDENASLQFAWIGNGGGKLRPASTFSHIGLKALHHVGRVDLWLDDQKMFEFAMQSPHAAQFKPTIYMLGKERRALASGAVADEAFVNIPAKWYFVEMANDAFETIDITQTS